ncbi:N-acetylgalactosaminyltransferase 7-like [Saccoglossus kowalevskii]|uniref:Polypeptide N-acetylgalactosaminyltransferase n=1 Tax=Saccoglossus kowalevskii TaxID=10224 RepID=A0ABM0N0I2_SACKO|nr:PREDICTED: N-acetylgalactosaminyltransferase 7-like [Saccoglossus kowalevskii]
MLNTGIVAGNHAGHQGRLHVIVYKLYFVMSRTCIKNTTMRFRKRRCMLLLIISLGFVYMARTLLLVNQVDRDDDTHVQLNGADMPRKPLQDSSNFHPGEITNQITDSHDAMQPTKRNGSYSPPLLLEGAVLRDTHGNYEPQPVLKLDGLGEKGVAVKFEQSEKQMVDKGIREYSFNQYISDKISLDREIKDLRALECMFWHYPVDLPKASVVIVFHNEGWSTLLRTVHSIVSRSPIHLLEEVILVDDFSDKGRRNQLSTVTCPIVDVIDNMDFRVYPQGDGKLARGAFDWEFFYKRVPITEEEVKRRKHQTEPYRSPVMAGGLFAMDKEYFFEMGAYDPGLQIWGGENYELSFKTWMCGGELLWVPCSHVGHIYRIHGRPPYTFPNGTLGTYQQKNYLRVAEVWMDEYRDYIYSKNPHSLSKVDFGDISAQRHFRKDNKCKTFHWFMETIAYDILKWYPLPPTNLFWGEIHPVDSPNLCLDTMGNNEGGGVGLTHCHGLGGNQMFRLTSVKDLRVADLCVTGKDSKPALFKCSGRNKAKITRDWSYNEITMKLYTKSMQQCLEHRGTMVIISPCDSRKDSQRWDFREV